jgi:hypothetical protein
MTIATGTHLSDVYDQFLSLVKDYRLINLFNLSPEHVEFEAYLEGWLIPAIRDFFVCDQDLTYAGKNFFQTLTSKNIVMLAQLLKKYWLEKEIDDITQMNLHVEDRDFKTFSENANMQAKQSRYNMEKEEISQLLVDYGLKNNEQWHSWLNGNFFPIGQ